MGFLKKYYSCQNEPPLPIETRVEADPPSKPSRQLQAYVLLAPPPTISEAKIHAIEAEALKLGWTLEQLWNICRRPDRKGLVALIRSGQTITTVAQQFIQLERTSLTGRQEISRFYNMRVDQPWIKHNR